MYMYIHAHALMRLLLLVIICNLWWLILYQDITFQKACVVKYGKFIDNYIYVYSIQWRN